MEHKRTQEDWMRQHEKRTIPKKNVFKVFCVHIMAIKHQ